MKMSQLTKQSKSIILASISGLAAFSPAIANDVVTPQVTDKTQVVFQEDFNGYADGAFPSSLIEVQRSSYRYAEVRDRWLAINMGGNPLLLLAPAVRDFSFSWEARAETGSEQLPVEISFRADGNLEKGAILALYLKENTCNLTLSLPGNAPLRLTDLPAPVGSVQDLRRFEVEVAGDVLTVKIDGKEIHSFQKAALPPGAGYVTVGVAQNAGLSDKVALPVFLNNLQLTSRDAGTPPIEKIWVHEFPVKILNDIFVDNSKDWNAKVKERVTIEKIKGTAAGHYFTDAKNGDVFRITGELDAPLFRMAIEDPYFRLESADGQTLAESCIFRGVVGGINPRKLSGAAHVLQATKSGGALPHYGVANRRIGAADANGPLRQSIYVRQLPEQFLVAAGARRYASDRYMLEEGSYEVLENRDGGELYAGQKVAGQTAAVELRHEASPGLLARLRKLAKGAGLELGEKYLSTNRHFLEGETPALRMSVLKKSSAPAPSTVRVRLLDAFFKPIGAESELKLQVGEKTLASAGIEKLSAPVPLPPLAPGVYHLEYQLPDGSWEWRAFSIVPGKLEAGKSAAAASGLPDIFSDFTDGADYNHYLTTCGRRVADPDTIAVRKALNLRVYWISAGHMAGDADAVATPEVLQHFDGIMHPQLLNKGEPPLCYPSPPARPNRYWLSNGFKPENIKAYVNSPFFPAGADPAKVNPRSPQHYAAWIKYWCSVCTQGHSELVDRFAAIKPGLDLISYGPSMAANWVDNSPYHARYNGYDLEQVRNKTLGSLIIESYASNFRRAFESYVPIMALSHLVTEGKGPRLFWELYGTGAGGNDERALFGCAPHAFEFPSPGAMQAQYAESSLGPWYFNGNKVVSGNDRAVFPYFASYTRGQLRGFMEGLKHVDMDVLDRPVKGSALVYSRAAADADRTWQMGDKMVGNFAAEAPAFSFVQTRKAGLPGGFFVNDSQVDKLTAADVAYLVIPTTRGLPKDTIAAVRRLHQAGVPLVAYDDVTGLEDIFGVRRVETGIPIEAVQRAATDTVLAGLPADVAAERIGHKGLVNYELNGASEILSGMDAGGRRVAPVLTLNQATNQAPAAFFVFGATELSRDQLYIEFGNQEGGVTSQLLQHAMRAVFRKLATPVVSVTAPASVLAFHRRDGGLQIALYESSWPEEPRHCTTQLTVRSPAHRNGKITATKPYRLIREDAEGRVLEFDLEPNELVTAQIVPAP